MERETGKDEGPNQLVHTEVMDRHELFPLQIYELDVLPPGGFPSRTLCNSRIWSPAVVRICVWFRPPFHAGSRSARACCSDTRLEISQDCNDRRAARPSVLPGESSYSGSSLLYRCPSFPVLHHFGRRYVCGTGAFQDVNVKAQSKACAVTAQLLLSMAGLFVMRHVSSSVQRVSAFFSPSVRLSCDDGWIP